MSSSTDNLNLLKPDPTENWSVQDHFNANMNKIDEFAGQVGAFSGQVGTNTNIGSFTTLSGLADMLDAMLTALPSAGVKVFQVTCSASLPPFSNGCNYMGTLYKSGTSNAWGHAEMREISSYKTISGRRTSSGGWGDWHLLAKGDTDASETTVTYGTNSTVVYRKVNGVVHVRVKYDAGADGAIAAWSSKNLTVLPTEYRPTIELTARACCDREPSSKAATITITSAGTCRVEARWQAIAGTSGDILYATFTFASV